jgi:hypothetical protein
MTYESSEPGISYFMQAFLAIDKWSYRIKYVGRWALYDCFLNEYINKN